MTLAVVHLTPSDALLIGFAVIAGIVGWRSKRGDFYKSVVEEKTAENEKLRADNTKLRDLKDLTPILQAIEKVSKSLESTAQVQRETLEKVRDMNGSLKAHSEAMKALADRLIVDEAARALLATASKGGKQ